MTSGFGGAGSFGGSAAGSAYVRLVLQSGQYQSQLKSAGTQTAQTVSKMGTQYTKLASQLKSAFTYLGAFAVIRASVKAWDAQVQAVARLNIAISNSPALVGATTAEFEAQASALAKLSGIQDEDILSLNARLALYDLNAEQLKEITPLVLDFAAATGQDVTAAATGVGRALLGNARALKAVGIDFTATGDRAKDYATITDALGTKLAGTAEAMKTPSMELAVAADEAFEAIGKGLTPALKGLADVLDDLPAPLVGAAIAFAALAIPLGGLPALAVAGGVALGALIKKIPGVEALTNAVAEGLGDGIAKLGGEMKNLETGDMIDGLVRMGREVDAGTMTFAELEKAVADYNDESGASINATALVGRELYRAALAAEVAETAIASFGAMTSEELIAWEEGASEAINFVEAALSGLSGQADLTAKELIASLQEAFQAQRDYAANSITAFSAIREEGFGLAGDELIAFLTQMGVGGARIVEILANMAGNSRAKFRSMIADMLAGGAAADATAGNIANLGSTMGAAAGQAIGLAAAIARLESKEITVTTYFSNVYSGVGGSNPKLGTGAAEGGIVRGAAGFITRGPTMIRPNVMVGEAGYSTQFGRGAEAVIPLTDATLDRLADAITRRGAGTGTINVNGYAGDPERLASYIVRYMARAS